MTKLSTFKRLSPGFTSFATAAVVLQSLTFPLLGHAFGPPPRTATASPIPVPVSYRPANPLQAAKPAQSKPIGFIASKLSGIASWYGRALHGHKTASGEIFDETALTACHRTLPFGTWVRVENLRNHESVIVRITDRGVLKPERVIDLSSAAAEKIGMLRDGTAPVRLSIIHP